MRSFQEPVEVVMDRNRIPLQLRWRQREFKVLAVSDNWCWAGKWWLTGKAQRRYYFRIEVQPASSYRLPYRSRTFEIYRKGGQWILSSVCD